MATDPDDARLEKLLSGEPPEVAALVRRLRAVVRRAHPDLQERVNPGWHGIAYHHPRGGYVCALFPRDGGVNVGFELGADLPDPHGRITGEGRTRDVRVVPGPDAAAEAAEAEIVVDYVDLAVDTAIDRLRAKRR